MAKKASRTTARYIRTTITVPRELKGRMDAASVEINWSAVAAAAFERKLDELAAASRSCSASLEGMVARLRDARRRNVDPAFEDGWRLGGDWAMRRADLDHLVLLERLARTMNDDDWLRLAAPHASLSPADELLKRMCPQMYTDPHQRAGFWREAGVGDPRALDQLAFVRGFCEAVLDAWAHVKDRVGNVNWWCPTDAARPKKRKR